MGHDDRIAPIEKKHVEENICQCEVLDHGNSFTSCSVYDLNGRSGLSSGAWEVLSAGFLQFVICLSLGIRGLFTQLSTQAFERELP